MVTITVHTSHFARTRNGAWVSAGATSENYEIPNDNDAGDHMSGTSCQSVTATWSDGVSVSVSYANLPVRGYGWGPFGFVVGEDGHEHGVRLHPRLPNHALGYYGVKRMSRAVLNTFEVHEPNY